jgi:chromate transporter
MKRGSLPHLFLTFLKIGSLSFGGFMALVAAVQKQVVERDKLISHEEVLDGISLASVLPGPLAVNVIAYIGYRLKGLRGALVSMAGILLPSFLFMLILSELYLRYGQMPRLDSFFAGVLPAVSAIIVSVALGMIKKSVADWKQVLLVLAAGVVTYFSKTYLSTVLIIAGSGILGYILYYRRGTSEKNKVTKAYRRPVIGRAWVIGGAVVIVFVVVMAGLPAIVSDKAPILLLHRKIMLTFSGLSLTLFGGGYVAVPSMKQIIVDTLQWLSPKEFADAIALGQVTPGPILVSATFVGYKLAGFAGALNATLSIFLPTAIVMLICGRFFNSIRESAILKAVFKGLRPAIIGMILSAAVTIFAHSGISVRSCLLLAVILVVVIKYNTDPVYIIPAAGLLGLILF